MPVAVTSAPASAAWRAGLPVLACRRLVLREPRLADAPALFAMLGTDDVARFISPPPSTVEGFERFVRWTHRQREAGAYVCFVIVPEGRDYPIGLIQVRQLDAGWHTAEWGFAVGSAFWGTGLFAEAAAERGRFRFRASGRAPARGPRRHAQRPRQWRAGQAGRRSRRAPPAVVPERRPVPGPGALGHRSRGLDAAEGGVVVARCTELLVRSAFRVGPATRTAVWLPGCLRLCAPNFPVFFGLDAFGLCQGPSAHRVGNLTIELAVS